MQLRTRFTTPFGALDIGDGLPTHLIAEIGLNHNGSEELAHEMIRSAALSGATFVKLQKRFPASSATAKFLDAPFEKCPALGTTQREVRERLELVFDAYVRLKMYAEGLGMIFFASAFDIPSLEFLQRVGVSIIKVASHSITNRPLLKELGRLKIPVIASFGGTTDREQDTAYELLSGNPLVLLHCVSAYPTPDQAVALDTIGLLRERYRVPVGFSSHEVGIDISIAASLLGACLIERHFTLSRAMIGLDQAISLEPEEFADMASKMRRLRACRGQAPSLQEVEKQAKYAYHVAVCAKREISAGTTLSEEMLVCKQPLTDPERFFTGLEHDLVVGSVARTNLRSDEAIPRDAVAIRE